MLNEEPRINIIYEVDPIESARNIIRKNLKMDLLDNVSHFNSTKITKLRNPFKICYFNTVMQILSYDVYFVRFFEMINFDEKSQPVSLIMKHMLQEITTLSEVCLLPYVEKLSMFICFNGVIKKNSGNIIKCINILLQTMQDENGANSVINFFCRYKIRTKLSVRCLTCGKEENIEFNKYSRCIELDRGLQSDLINREMDMQIQDSKFPKCNDCGGMYDKESIHLRTILPEIFIIELERLKSIGNVFEFVNMRYPIYLTLDIANTKFDLYGISLVQSYRKSYHSTIILKNDNGWVKFDDDNVEKINIETFKEAYQNSYHLLYRRCL